MTKSLLVSLILVLGGFGCVESTNHRLDTMNSSMDRLATQVEGDQQYIKTTTEQVQSLNDNSGRIAKETETYEESIKTLAEQLKNIATSMADFEKMGTDVMSMLREALKPVPPGKTSDIEDVIKNRK